MKWLPVVLVSLFSWACVGGSPPTAQPEACNPEADTMRCLDKSVIQACDSVSSAWQTSQTCNAGTECSQTSGSASCEAVMTQGCESDLDCTDGTCVSGSCLPDHCNNGQLDGDEMDIDCGGSCPLVCQNDDSCVKDGECFSGCCIEGLCGDPEDAAVSCQCDGSGVQCGTAEPDDGLLEPPLPVQANTLGLCFPDGLVQARFGHTVTATVNGEVLVAGGSAPSGATFPGQGLAPLRSVEVFRSGDSEWGAPHSTGDMFNARVWHAATAIDSGQVFLSGGKGDSSPDLPATERVELYSPSQAGGSPGIEVLAKVMGRRRWGHTATLINPETYDVLIVGGDEDGEDATYEIWSPYTGTLGVFDLPDGQRRHHQATLFTMPTGGQAVLISGGESPEGARDSLLIYELETHAMLHLALPSMSSPRSHHVAVWVPSRQYIYLTGGTSPGGSGLGSIDVYDVLGNAILTPQGFGLKQPRYGHAGARAGENQVVLAGGAVDGAPLDSAELIHESFDATANATTVDVALLSDKLPAPVIGPRAVRIGGGAVLFAGGLTATGAPSTQLVCYQP